MGSRDCYCVYRGDGDWVTCVGCREREHYRQLKERVKELEDVIRKYAPHICSDMGIKDE